MVARAFFHIAYWSALAVSAQTYAPSRAIAAEPSPFEVTFQDLDPADQRLYRALREGLAEAERRRSASGRWPSSPDLAREGVPPFAPDPIDRARHAWTSAQRGTVLNYAGTPDAASGKQTLLAIVTEPDPGTAPDPGAQVDDVHHRLDDGTMIHVTVWIGPGLDTREAAGVVAPDQGWRQIMVSK